MSEEVKDDSLSWVLDKLAAKQDPKLAPKKDLKLTKVKEVELWTTWKDSGFKPKHLNPLLKSLTPLIENHVSGYRGRTEIPVAAFNHEVKQRTVDALKRWDPKKSALNTWLTNNISKIGRWVINNQNFARITEPVSLKIGKYKAAHAELLDRLGHEPDTEAIAEHTGWSKKEVIRLQKDQRKELISSHEDDVLAPINVDDSVNEVIQLVVPQLTPQERTVHEYVFGLNGKPRLKTSAIAKKMKWDDSKVSKIKTSIHNKMRPFLPT